MLMLHLYHSILFDILLLFFSQPHKKNHKAKRTPTAIVKCVNSRWGCWIFSGCLSHFVRLNFNHCRFATKCQGVTVGVAMTQRHQKPAQDRSWQGNRGGQSGIILLQRHKIFTLCPMTDQTLLSWVESISNSGPVFLFGVGLTPILLVLRAASKLSDHLAKQPFRAFFPKVQLQKICYQIQSRSMSEFLFSDRGWISSARELLRSTYVLIAVRWLMSITVEPNRSVSGKNKFS